MTLDRPIETAMWEHYRQCRLCPWNCSVDRTSGPTGRCRASARLRVNDYMPHFGEEACLVGEGGSGAVFFSFCTLRCRFCQTHEMSWRGEGTEIGVGRLAECFLWLQQEGCINLNLITPTHFLPHILSALNQARSEGFKLPVVYNTSGFETPDVLRQLEGTVDIYLPDFKFWEEETAEKLCGAACYPEVARKAIKEMHRQVGDLLLDDQGKAVQGILVRHLILPGYINESQKILEWIAEEISIHTYINLMGHYRPCHQARKLPSLNRSLSRSEYEKVCEWARQIGLYRIDSTHEKLYPLIWRKE